MGNEKKIPPGVIAAKFAELFKVELVDISSSVVGNPFHRLYHRTTPEAAGKIMAEGFRDPEPDDEGSPIGVWLSGYLDCMGEKGRTLLTIELDVASDLGQYRQEVEFQTLRPGANLGDPEGDSDDDWIEDPEGESVCWYCIPAAVLNSFAKVRLVTREEEDHIKEFGEMPGVE